MNGCLDEVENWPVQAKRGGYRVKVVAHQLGVSTRWLELFFKRRFRKSPHCVFAQWRESEIRQLAIRAKIGKEIAVEVGFSHCSSLSRSLSHDGGFSLRQLRRE